MIKEKRQHHFRGSGTHGAGVCCVCGSAQHLRLIHLDACREGIKE